MREKKVSKMVKFQLLALFVSLLVIVSGLPTRDDEKSKTPIHIIQPPTRCPEGTKPDANGRCRKVWDRSLSDTCVDVDENGDCVKIEESNRNLEDDCLGDCLTQLENSCAEGENESCMKIRKLNKRDISETENEEQTKRPGKKMKNSERRSRRKSDGESENDNKKNARSKHAFLIMLKKKKMQMMKPKPPPPPPHHPPHHHHPESEEPEEEEEEEEPPAEEEGGFQRLFFGDETCSTSNNTSEPCRQDAEMVENVEQNKDFKEWKPPKSSESSDSSDSSSSSSSSSSSDGESESESEPRSKESEDEILERAIKIKLMKIFRMKQRYGPALRQWFVDRLKEYEDRKEKKEIISTRCLEAVKETMEVIKDNLEVEGLFTTSGNLRTRKKIQSYLSRGDIYTLRNWGFEFIVECAAALKIFLQNLPQPLIPVRIQQLVVADNSGVPEKTIANDALGLLKEEVNGRHKELLIEVFTFLKEAAVKVNTSELTGCNLPLKLLPVFFDIESNDPQKFRDIATVFHEIIMEAPEHLKTPCRKIPSGELILLERIFSQDMRVPGIPVMHPPNMRNHPTGENAEWRIPVPRVPHTRLHPWLGRIEHSTT